MEFVDSKLVAYDKKMKKLNRERLDNLSELSDVVYRKLHKINSIDNEKIILDIALSLNDDIEQSKSHAIALAKVKRDLKIYSEDEMDDRIEEITKSSDQQVFWQICHEHRGMYDTLIEQTFIMPWKKTWDYSDCKGMFDMNIIELAKAIKKDLQGMFPDIRWSVTSERNPIFSSRDKVNIKALKIPINYLEGPRFEEYTIKSDILKEIFSYREEFTPRCHIYVDYWVKEEQIME